MNDEEKKELESKISELKKELDLWEKYRELKNKIDELKKDNPPITITYPVYPYYPVYPTYPTIPSYPWYKLTTTDTSGGYTILCGEK